MFWCFPKICINLVEFHSFRSLEGRFPKIGFRFFGDFPIKPQKESNFRKNLNPPRRVSDSDLGKHPVCIYIYMYDDESNNGTLFAQKRVKQRDAHALNNGTRPVSHYKNGGFALFWGGWLATLGRRCDGSTMSEPRKLVGLVFRIFGLVGNRISSFWGFVSFSLYFFELRHWKHYKIGV